MFKYPYIDILECFSSLHQFDSRHLFCFPISDKVDQMFSGLITQTYIFQSNPKVQQAENRVEDSDNQWSGGELTCGGEVVFQFADF